MTEESRIRTFNVGDRVIVRSGTTWDTDLSVGKLAQTEREYFLAEGNYGHVVERPCDCCCLSDLTLVHVVFQGSTKVKSGTFYMDGYAWHMYSHELEHCD